MKKTHYLSLVFVCLIFSLLLSCCSGYNSIMRSHLENAENYNSYSAELTSIYYYDKESSQKISDYSAPEFADNSVIFEVVFSDHEFVRNFLGGTPNPDIPLSEFTFQLTVTKENNQILAENGFYEKVSLNTPIDIIASDYIYMDTDFFFIASATYDNTEYLNFETGLSNIVEMINKEKSLF